MPNWSDDEGRCHFEVDGTPCYQSGGGCPAHRVKPQRQRTKTPWEATLEDAFRRGAEAMREMAAKECWLASDELASIPDMETEQGTLQNMATRIRAIPLPKDKP